MEVCSIVNQSLAHTTSYALRCAVELDIAGHIQAYGRPMPLDKLARSIPVPPKKDAMLAHLMGLLVHREVFAKSEEGYTLTPTSKHLLTKGSNMGSFVRYITDLQFTQYMCDISKWFKDDGPETAFAMGNDGDTFWDVMKKPGIGKLFNEAMATHSKQFMRDLVTQYQHLFDGLTSLVDVGGGTGSAAKMIADAFPNLKCTVLDLPHVVAKAPKDDSFNVVGGDMFEKIPSADAILLKNVLHDWCDDDCVRILKRCKEAIEPKKDVSKVIVISIVQDMEDLDPIATETSFVFDMFMNWSHGSKLRSKQEWHDLIVGAGYSGYKISPLPFDAQCVIELYP